MYGNVDAAILWLILLAKYLINEWNLKKSKAESCILYKKDDKGKLKLAISVYVYDVFMSGKPEKLKNTKENNKKNSNIKESGKVENFLGVYYEWGREAKG